MSQVGRKIQVMSSIIEDIENKSKSREILIWGNILIFQKCFKDFYFVFCKRQFIDQHHGKQKFNIDTASLK